MPNMQQNDRLHVLRSRLVPSRFSPFSSCFSISGFCRFSCFRAFSAGQFFVVGSVYVRSSSFPVRLGRRHHPPLLQSLPPLINIAEVERWMKANAYELSTIRQTLKRLRFLTANCNTNEPEEVKQFVAAKPCSNSYKECLI